MILECKKNILWISLIISLISFSGMIMYMGPTHPPTFNVVWCPHPHCSPINKVSAVSPPPSLCFFPPSRKYVWCPQMQFCVFVTLGSVLDSKWSWEFGKFRLVRWSHRLFFFGEFCMCSNPFLLGEPIHTDTWPQFDYQSSSTCIFESGTSSWAC